MSATLDDAFEIKTLLWFFDPPTHSDKIWGVVEIDGICYNFWGRRADLSSATNGKFSFKRLDSTLASRDIAARAREKEHKGYQKIDCSRAADGTYPGLERFQSGFVEEFASRIALIRAFGSATVRDGRLS